MRGNLNPFTGVMCDRCTSIFVGHGDWNVTLEKGVVAGLLCPACQTVDENVEAVINESTIDYSVDDGGLVRGQSKGVKPE